METKYDQLAKLKQLLDSGALTQGEFEAAKQRLLSTDVKEPVNAVKQSNATDSSSPKTSYKKWLIFGIGAAVIIVIIALLSSGKKQRINAPDDNISPETLAECDSVVTVVAEETEYYDGDPSTLLMSVEDDEANKTNTKYGGWEKSYFRDDFNELDYSKPFMSLWVGQGGYNVNLAVLYRPSGSFAFKLFDDDGDIREVYGSSLDMTIRVNGNDIGPVTFDVRKNEWYVTGDDTRVMSTIFNQGSFAISISYESYGGETIHYVFNVKEAKGSFERAVTHLLGTAYMGE